MKYVYALTASLAVLASSSTAWACAVCFGEVDAKTAQAINWGVLSLLLFTGFLLATFAGFFIYLARREHFAQKQNSGIHSEGDVEC